MSLIERFKLGSELNRLYQ